eukprot:jgi/Bigna1/84780/estExt_fgenesh1_pg.C_10046
MANDNHTQKPRKKRFFKMAYGEDMRRFPVTLLSAKTFSEFLALVRTTFDVDPDGIVVQYRDDEDDLVDISSDRELREAFDVMETEGRTLKLFLKDLQNPKRTISSGILQPSPSSPESRSATVGVECEEKTKPGARKHMKKRAHRVHSSQSSMKHEGQCDKEILKNLVKESVCEFFSDEKVVSAIQGAVPEFISNMLDGKGFQTSLEVAIKSQEVLREHYMIKMAMPHLRKFTEIFPPQICLGMYMLELVPKLHDLFTGPVKMSGLPLFRKIICTLRSTGKEVFKGSCPLARMEKRHSGRDQKYSLPVDDCGSGTAKHQAPPQVCGNYENSPLNAHHHHHQQHHAMHHQRHPRSHHNHHHHRCHHQSHPYSHGPSPRNHQSRRKKVASLRPIPRGTPGLQCFPYGNYGMQQAGHPSTGYNSTGNSSPYYHPHVKNPSGQIWQQQQQQQQTPFRYDTELRKLKDMGYKNEQFLRHSLEAVNGNVDEVLKLLRN